MKNLVILFICLVTCTYVSAQEKKVNKTFSNINSIKLNTASGDITLKKGKDKDVKVLVVYTYSDDQYKVVLEQSDTKLTLKEEFERGSNTGSSSWTLEIPDNVKINLNSGSGDISVEKLVLDMKSNTGSGDVVLTAVKGDLDCNTGSGDIELDGVEGEVKMNTGSGDVRAINGTGNYSFNVGSGNIQVEQLSGDFNINTGSGDVNAKNLAITSSSSFNSGSGDASVILNASLENSISVNSGSGDATLNFTGHEINGEVIMTANEKNGEIKAPFKFDKEETVEDKYNSSPSIRKTTKIGSKDIKIKVGTGSGTAEILK